MKIIAKILPMVSCCAFFTLFACGGGGGDTAPQPSDTAKVEFVYMANTELDQNVVENYSNCVRLVGNTHIHPSWREFSLVLLKAFPPSEFRKTFTDVPVGYNRIRISDGNTCAINSTGASTENVFANGVLLTNIVDTLGEGMEPGLSFVVTADGTVTP